MRGRTRGMALAAITSIALVATACGGGGSDPQPGSSQAGGQSGGEITVYGCTPKNPLVPGDTNEACGSYIVVPITAKLIRYDVENASPINDIAESIETKDNKLFTVKLKPYKFHDGTEVKAKNFVDAWNYTAYGPNGQANSYFFGPVTGYADTQCPDADCKQTPKAKTLAGLKVVDDKTFTIKTAEPVSNLPVRLGYNAFAPLPDSFFADPKAYEEKPIGAGPFKLESKTNTEFVLTKFADYGGDPKPSVDKVTLRIYQDSPAAYADIVANNLDYLDTIPPDQLVGEAFKDDLPDRWLQRESGRFTNVTFSPWDPQMKNVELRKSQPDRRQGLQRHSDPRHRLGVSGGGRLQGRRLWRCLQLRRGQSQGCLRRGRRLQGHVDDDLQRRQRHQQGLLRGDLQLDQERCGS